MDSFFFAFFQVATCYISIKFEGVNEMKIALVGYARSGKDTVGKMIINYMKEHGHDTTRQLAFGDNLRERMFEAFPEVRQQKKKPREWFETFGELGRRIDTDIWVNAVDSQYKFYKLVGYQNFVITDLRQPNEAEWARENGFTIIKIDSPVALRAERSKDDTGFQGVNYSERLLHEIEADYSIMNLYSEERLQERVYKLMGGLSNGN